MKGTDYVSLKDYKFLNFTFVNDLNFELCNLFIHTTKIPRANADAVNDLLKKLITVIILEIKLIEHYPNIPRILEDEHSVI